MIEITEDGFVIRDFGNGTVTKYPVPLIEEPKPAQPTFDQRLEEYEKKLATAQDAIDFLLMNGGM